MYFWQKVGYWVCRRLRKNIEEELWELNSRVAEMSSETGEAAIQKLQSDIKFCKNILQCSVCTDRPKEVRKNIYLYFCLTSVWDICYPSLNLLITWLILVPYYSLPGGNCEVLSSILQLLCSKESRDPSPEVSCLWNSVWSEWHTVCKDMKALSCIMIPPPSLIFWLLGIIWISSSK